MFRAELAPGSIAKLRRMAAEAGPTMKRNVNKGLRAGGELGVKVARDAVLGDLPPKADQRTRLERLTGAEFRHGNNHGHSGLRAGIARGVRVTLGGVSGIRIASTSSGLPAYQKGMNRVYSRPTWRHPVFGNRKAWANQHGKDWFYRPIRDIAVPLRESIEVAVKAASEEISKGL